MMLMTAVLVQQLLSDLDFNVRGLRAKVQAPSSKLFYDVCEGLERILVESKMGRGSA